MEQFVVPASLGKVLTLRVSFEILIFFTLFLYVICYICSYLLEKSRVINQQDAERNYHFFYQIVAAAADNADLSRALFLSDTDEHYYISQSSVNVIEGVSDLEEFNEVQSAMEVLFMTKFIYKIYFYFNFILIVN